ncbi:VWA domain-containing protein [Candidatus Chloroploca sp. M-50]|uniref:VWA domain-containing protein n=1 Tax=Candidatus Chloroploca mongolica TaxID=2528176 RepID=A0ABS4D4S8_9CHLR|nr:VWA domain-containing protein [Candidatus Chloroploca mongolica]MBP1464442.1 VWA domain-containing protein [Candidatus Chloroploca mongolica]
MFYRKEVNREHPTCLVFLIDRSYSMSKSQGGSEEKKADVLASLMNDTLYKLVRDCVKDAKEGPRHYFDIGVIEYGRRDREKIITSALNYGSLAGRWLISIRDIADNPLRIESRNRIISDGRGGTTNRTVRAPIWIDPVYENGTPTRKAMAQVYDILQPWVNTHQSSFPPTVIHVTDGESDEDPSSEAERIRSLRTLDGQVLLFNIHLSERDEEPVRYPSTMEGLPDDFACQLFKMSSTMPESLQIKARELGIPLVPGSRGFVFNARFDDLQKFLTVGTTRKEQA